MKKSEIEEFASPPEENLFPNRTTSGSNFLQRDYDSIYAVALSNPTDSDVVVTPRETSYTQTESKGK